MSGIELSADQPPAPEVTDDHRRAAMLACADAATDAADLALILAALGLLDQELGVVA